MKLIVDRIDTGVKLPPLNFTVEVKELIARHEKLNLSIETLLNNFRTLQLQTKIDVPGFKAELWYAWIDEKARCLNFRFGHGGLPQLVIKEVEA